MYSFKFILLLIAVGIPSAMLMKKKHRKGGCEDKERKDCPGWKNDGFCKKSNQWYGYMKENCKKSCGFCPQKKPQVTTTVDCKDKQKPEQCSSWKKSGFCRSSSQYIVYMTKECARTCGFCVFKGATECKDKNSNCPSWASKDECKKNPTYMNANCQKSCGICGSKFSAGAAECKDKNSDCPSWASKDECKKNPTYMNANCQKSCGICGSKSSGQCKDTFDTTKCQLWAEEGECEENIEWMAKNCQKSCEECTDATSTSGTTKTETKKKETGTTTINDVYCGLRLKLRVVGGEDAKSGEWPWQIAIAKKSKPTDLVCGGTLINRQWVLTASHCFGGAKSNRYGPADFVIRIGDHNLKKNEGIEIVSDVSMIIRHEGYGYGSYNNDITLMKLKNPIKYSQNIKPICLPEPKKEEKENQMCYVTGWGRLSESGKIAQVLQEAKIPIVKRQTCKDTLGLLASYTSNMICAGYKKGGIDACQGDSGGPFVCDNGGRFELVGVVSWGQGCARKNTYGVYTKVSNYIDWIKANIQK